MATRIKKDLYEQLIKIKRQKKGISGYLIKLGYSKKFANDVSKNWKELEVIGGPVNVSTKKTAVKKTVSKSKKVTAATPPPLPIQQVQDTVQAAPAKELVLNISEGLEVMAEVQVKNTAHPRTILGSIVKNLQKTGATVTFNAGLDLANAPETLDGFTLAVNEAH